MGVPFAEVIGDPIGHSKSPAMHRHWLDRLGIKGDYRALRVPAGETRAYFAERRANPDWRGCNVTAPLKIEVMAHLSALGPDARSIGAVNTIVHQGEGELLGINTDAHGALLALARVRAEHAVLIGAGGAARAALFALKVLQVPQVTVLNRDMHRARAALDDLEVEGRVLPLGTAPAADLLVNASTLGMGGNPPVPFDLSALPPTAVVFDMVYAPVETDLLARARARGLATIDGLTMLAEQGAMAFAAFFEGGPDRADTPELRELLSR
ncbi:MAG TPA: shikimate dehydrogenase [Allosphingosinicella sp.]|jgi:shikimate dehydrogenase